MCTLVLTSLIDPVEETNERIIPLPTSALGSLIAKMQSLRYFNYDTTRKTRCIGPYEYKISSWPYFYNICTLDLYINT